MILIPEQAATLHITSVILWRNNFVSVFDNQGQQMTEYQGQYYGVHESIDNIFTEFWEYEDEYGDIKSYGGFPWCLWLM